MSKHGWPYWLIVLPGSTASAGRSPRITAGRNAHSVDTDILVSNHGYNEPRYLRTFNNLIGLIHLVSACTELK
jgi:hypothetical protein